ncbi:MAG: metal ABC transporter substrate-binding protein [Candidatus Goldiibacteriota bacterium]
MLKKLFLTGVSVLFVFSVYASQTLNIITSTTDLASIASEIGGKAVKAESLSRGDIDPHRVDPRPSMVMKARAADLAIVMGMDLDIWMDSVLEASKNSKVIRGGAGYLDVSARIDKMGLPEGRVDGRRGHIHIHGNPHFWNSPEEGLVIAEDIYLKLKELSPENSDYFTKNYNAFSEKLRKKTVEWKKRLAPYTGAHIVLFHDSWPYFMRCMGLETALFVEPQPGIPPSAAHTAKVIKQIKERGLKLLISENYQDKRTIRRIEEETGIKALVLPASVGGVKGIDDYISLIEHNVSMIEKVLGGSKE